MRIIFVLFFAISLYAGMIANIIYVNNDIINLNKNIKKGISGIVLCPYEKEEIICARCVSLGEKKAKLYVYKDLQNKAFALPVVLPKVGDKVIFGKNYKRIMIIAPNQEVYLKLKEKYQNSFTIIPVDVFAAFLDDIPIKKDFVKFAREMNIGLFVFALDRIYFVDSDSFYDFLTQNYTFKPNLKFKKPFYSSYNFDIKMKNPIEYYKNFIKGIKW